MIHTHNFAGCDIHDKRLCLSYEDQERGLRDEIHFIQITFHSSNSNISGVVKKQNDLTVTNKADSLVHSTI